VLLVGLHAENPRVAAKAAWALGEVAPPSQVTLGALEKARQHEYRMVQEAAEEAIRKIQASALPANKDHTLP